MQPCAITINEPVCGNVASGRFANGDYESGVAGAARRREKAPQEEAGRDGKLIRGEGMRVPPFAANAFRAGWFTGREARAPLRLTGQDGRVVCQGSRLDWRR
jgi:hypothetical protein